MRVFLTGGTGFIGGEVARLLRERGDEVVALVRTPAKAAALTALGCELASVDLSDEDALRTAMKGSDAVIHCAAVYEIGVTPARREALVDANVRGTERVLGAALASGIRKTVYVSTVYGPGDTSEIGGLSDRVLAGKLPLLPFPDLGVTPVHRDDVGAGILLALDRGTSGSSYVLAGEPIRMGALVAKLARVAGGKPPRGAVSTFLLRGLAPFGRVVGPVLGFPSNLREVVSSSDGVTFWASSDKAQRELGWSFRPLAEGLATVTSS